jgi:hypothetical protein
MIAFTRGERVRVIWPGPLEGRIGTVARLRHADDAAWVRMDEPLPAGMERFPAGDPRYTDVCLQPEECEPCA